MNAPAWYVAATESGQEDLARGECGQRGIQTFLPLVRRIRELRDGRRLRVIEKAFPGYLFVLVAERADWHQLKRCRGIGGVLHAVGDAERPARVPQQVMTELLVAGGKSGILESLSAPPDLPRVEVGQRVVITSGLFAGQAGTCEWSAAQRVSVLLQAIGLGRVTIERRYVEPIDAP